MSTDPLADVRESVVEDVMSRLIFASDDPQAELQVLQDRLWTLAAAV